MIYLSGTLRNLTRRLSEIAMTQAYAAKFQAGMSIGQIEAEYMITLEDLMVSYLDSARPITAFRNEFRRAANDAMILAVAAGWADGEGYGPIPDSLNTWVLGRIEQEVTFITGVFEELKQLRKEGDPEPMDSFVGARVAGYTASIGGVYNYAVMMAKKLSMGVWQLGRTERHCGTCAGLHGQVRTLRWFLDNGYIPRQPGNPNLECGGWHCDCSIVDPETGKQII